MDTIFKGQKLQISSRKMKADFVKQGNAKVRVQYIQNHQIVEKDGISDVEAENVEYLDESTIEEQPTKLLTDSGQTSEPFKDTFYANAIHCMIDLYKRKYQDMKGKTLEQIRAMFVWDQITKDMNDCLFRFNCSQIQHKFRQLREQYFGVASPEEADSFEYFDQLHDLYQDKYIDSIAAGVCKRDKTLQAHTYPDEGLQLNDRAVEKLTQKLTTEPHEHNYQTATAEEVVVETHLDANDDIAHKEHEFINMVEKELQAIVEGNVDENCVESVPQEILSNDVVMHQHQEEIAAHEEVDNCTAITSMLVHDGTDEMQNVVMKRDHHHEEPTQDIKRIKVEPQRVTSISTPNVMRLHVKPAQSQQITATHIVVPSETVNDKINGEMTLAAYNTHQERRHREKLELLRQSLALQERALEIQKYLMEELIKRL